MSACVLDSDVVIAALDRSDAHHQDAGGTLLAMIEDRVDLLVSTVNYAEALVKPAEDEGALQAAVDAIAALGIKPIATTARVARDAARHRSLGVSLADGFALATAQARFASVMSFDRRVRRAVSNLGLALPDKIS